MIWPTTSLSLKVLATSLGFRWRDTDPSGAASIQWFHRCVETGDPSVRQRILDDNGDDCRASSSTRSDGLPLSRGRGTEGQT